MKAFLLLVFLSSNQAMVSGPYTQQECEQQADMVRGPSTGARFMPFYYPRKKGEVECVRDGSFPPATILFDPMPTNPRVDCISGPGFADCPIRPGPR